MNLKKSVHFILTAFIILLLSFDSPAFSSEKMLGILTEYNYKAAKLRNLSASYYVYTDFEDDKLESINEIINKYRFGGLYGVSDGIASDYRGNYSKFYMLKHTYDGNKNDYSYMNLKSKNIPDKDAVFEFSVILDYGFDFYVTDNSNNKFKVVSFNNNGIIYYGDSMQGGTFQCNRWYKIAVCYDYNLGIFDLYINGKIVKENFSVSGWNEKSNIKNAGFCFEYGNNTNVNSICGLDNIKVYQGKYLSSEDLNIVNLLSGKLLLSEYCNKIFVNTEMTVGEFINNIYTDSAVKIYKNNSLSEEAATGDNIDTGNVMTITSINSESCEYYDFVYNGIYSDDIINICVDGEKSEILTNGNVSAYTSYGCTLILALYDPGGRITDLDFSSSKDEKSRINVKLNDVIAAEGTYVKAMLWNSLFGANPQTAVKCLKSPKKVDVNFWPGFTRNAVLFNWYSEDLSHNSYFDDIINTYGLNASYKSINEPESENPTAIVNEKFYKMTSTLTEINLAKNKFYNLADDGKLKLYSVCGRHGDYDNKNCFSILEKLCQEISEKKYYNAADYEIYDYAEAVKNVVINSESKIVTNNSDKEIYSVINGNKTLIPAFASITY